MTLGVGARCLSGLYANGLVGLRIDVGCWPGGLMLVLGRLDRYPPRSVRLYSRECGEHLGQMLMSSGCGWAGSLREVSGG